MPYTVVGPEAMGNDAFWAVMRPYLKQGGERYQARRTREPASGLRWLPVWDKKPEVEAFVKDLRKETKEERWAVATVPAGAVSEGPLGMIQIEMGNQGDEYVYGPELKAVELMDRFFPERKGLRGIVFELPRARDFEADQEFWAPHVVRLLTGLRPEEIEFLGGSLISNYDENKVLFVTPEGRISVAPLARSPNYFDTPTSPPRRTTRRPA